MTGDGKRRTRFHRAYTDTYLLGAAPSTATRAALHPATRASLPPEPRGGAAESADAVSPAPAEGPHPLDAPLPQRTAAGANGERRETETAPQPIVDALGLFRHLDAGEPPLVDYISRYAGAGAAGGALGPRSVEWPPEAVDDTMDSLLERDAALAWPEFRPPLQLVPALAADSGSDTELDIPMEDAEEIATADEQWALEVDVDDDTFDSQEEAGTGLDQGPPLGSPLDFAAAVRWALSGSADDSELDAWLAEEAQ